MTFPFPSFLREIFPPFTAISVTGYPLQNKRPSSRVTQSQYGQLVCVWTCHTVTSVLLLLIYQTYRGENATWVWTRWLITIVRCLMHFYVNVDCVHSLLANVEEVRFASFRFSSKLWNFKLAFSVFDFLLFFFVLIIHIEHTLSSSFYGWRDPLWHIPDWVPVSIFVPNIGHYHLLCVDVTSCPQYVRSVGGHETNAFLNLLFSYFMGLL